MLGALNEGRLPSSAPSQRHSNSMLLLKDRSRTCQRLSPSGEQLAELPVLRLLDLLLSSVGEEPVSRCAEHHLVGWYGVNDFAQYRPDERSNVRGKKCVGNTTGWQPLHLLLPHVENTLLTQSLRRLSSTTTSTI